MFGAYGYTYDDNYLDDFRELFTGCYEFTAVKHEGVCRFSRWVLRVDQANV